MDFIIVGGGMAGLYMGLILKAMSVRFKLIEADSRLGGRAWTEQFAGVDVVTGAGIGRKRKDKLLMSLNQGWVEGALESVWKLVC
jgi:monoamine oxidase